MGKGGGGVEQTTFEYYQTLALLVCEGPIKRFRRIWAGSDVIYDDRPEQVGWSSRPLLSGGRRPSLASFLNPSEVEVYLGTQTQGRSPTLEALIGTDDCHAHRGSAYIVLKNFPRHKYGGGLPTFSIEVESEGTDGQGRVSLSYVINAILDMAKFPEDARDFSAVDSVTVDGFILQNRDEARKHLDGLQAAYLFDFVDVDWQLKAIPRGGTSAFLIEPEHVGSGTPEPAADNIQSTRMQAIEVPQRVDVVYQSASIDFQTFTQTTNREAAGTSNGETITLPVVMNEVAAMAVARRSLAAKQAARESHKVSVPMLYGGLHPGMVGTLPLEDGGNVLVKITDMVTGLFGHVELTLVTDDPDAYLLSGDGAATPGSGTTSQSDGAAIVWAGDINALTTLDDSSFDGCSLLMVVGSPRMAWGGGTTRCQARVRDVNGRMQENLSTHTISGSLGSLTATLAQWRGGNVWDNTSTLTLKLASVFTAYAAAYVSNTGNGIIEMADPPTNSGVMAGAYLVEFTSSTAFVVKDPTAATVGTGTVGTTFSIEVRFKITAGTTAFVSGDRFTVTAAPTGAVIGDPPQGATDADVLDGANVLVVGGEVIQFAQVTDLGNNQYTLTRLLRGRRGTEHIAWTAHSIGEPVVFLPDNGEVQRFKANLSEVGNTKTINVFETGAVGRDYSNTQSTTVVMEGNARKPWAPGAVKAVRDGANDVALSWKYRSRWGDGLENGTPAVRLGETLERYDLEVWDSTFTTLKRTVSALTSPAYTYTSAMQVADFGAASTFGLKLYQVSALVGRGFPSRTVVP